MTNRRFANSIILHVHTSPRVQARVVSGKSAADYADFADLNNWSPAGNGPAFFRVIRAIRGHNLGLTTPMDYCHRT